MQPKTILYSMQPGQAKMLDIHALVLPPIGQQVTFFCFYPLSKAFLL